MPDKRTDYMSTAKIIICVPGIEKLLANLKPTKAAGPDHITPRVLRELAKQIAPILTTIFRSSLKTGVVFSDWNEALDTPVFKNGQHYNSAKYRLIPLTSMPCKLLDHMLVDTIMDHLETNNMLGWCFEPNQPLAVASWLPKTYVPSATSFSQIQIR